MPGSRILASFQTWWSRCRTGLRAPARERGVLASRHPSPAQESMARLRIDVRELLLERGVHHDQRAHRVDRIAAAGLDGVAYGGLKLGSFVDGGLLLGGVGHRRIPGMLQ